ncbi:unnamed protein product, partial [Symbiodinium microadriaticum]
KTPLSNSTQAYKSTLSTSFATTSALAPVGSGSGGISSVCVPQFIVPPPPPPLRIEKGNRRRSLSNSSTGSATTSSSSSSRTGGLPGARKPTKTSQQ